MPAIFPRLLFWDDPVPRTAPVAFAIDELLLDLAVRESTPLLRRYHWDGHWLSFGYFQRWDQVRPSLPSGCLPARRWTGGGMVDHARDEPYSLIVPAGFPLASDSAAVSYRRLHTLLAAALSCGTLVPGTSTKSSAPGSCFHDKPSPGDVVTSDGTKIAGAAQRRTALGLLHQGSLAQDRLPSLPADAWSRFTAFLGDQVEAWSPDVTLLSAARSLAAARYASPAWLHRR